MPAPQPVAAPAAPLRPAAPATTAAIGSAAARALFSPAAGGRDLALWGSSSMSSERGDESTPLPIRIHQHLQLTIAPGTVHAHGVGATWSQHAVLMRGLDTPHATPTGTPDPVTGAVTLTLDPELPPRGAIAFPASVGEREGTLDGSSGTWIFTPSEAGDPVTAGTLVSALGARTAAARQVLWMGKNNIRDTARVLEDTQRMWDAAPDPEQDTLVLGQWATEHDPRGSATAEALAAVNAEQASRYGDHFVDVQALLTSESGLSCAPLVPLQVLEQATTQDALAQGVVPPVLIAHDLIHLNGWGNLAVGWTLIRRMRELGWL